MSLVINHISGILVVGFIINCSCREKLIFSISLDLGPAETFSTFSPIFANPDLFSEWEQSRQQGFA